jgi:hypothetical protein
MTAEQLQQLGTRQVAYLSAGIRDDEIVFIIHGADGTPILMVEDLKTAMAMVVRFIGASIADVVRAVRTERCN